MTPMEFSQLHASERRVLLEGNRVLNDEKEEARRQAMDGDAGRRESVREANRQRVAEHSGALREKWGVA